MYVSMEEKKKYQQFLDGKSALSGAMLMGSFVFAEEGLDCSQTRMCLFEENLTKDSYGFG